MLYEPDISRLGFGCMRLPRDHATSESLILHALDQGIRYFDTAYIYPGNEELLGKIIDANGCRDRMDIATKIPHYLINSADDFDRIFETSLKRLQTDHVEYYLMHMLPDGKTWDRLCSLGIEEWLAEKKGTGQIGKVGFSYHGKTADFLDLLDRYPWEFVQVQYNYMDETSQAGRAGVETAAEKGIPVIVMEPLRGGLLADRLPEAAKGLINDRGAGAVEVALRWLWDQPAVSMVLSGMTSCEMIDENLRIAHESPAGCLGKEDRDFYETLKSTIHANMKVGCTGCNYCMPCPYGVSIPDCFRCYNSSYSDSRIRGIREYFMVTAFSRDGSFASLCQSCGKCQEHCPQSIPIPEELKKVRRRLEIPGFGPARWFVRRKLLKSEK